MSFRERLSRFPVLRALCEGRGVISLCLTMLAICLVALAGPYMSIGEAAPLAATWIRALVVSLLFLSWCVYYGLRYVVPGTAAEAKNAHDVQARQFREARRIRRALFARPLLRSANIERHVWWPNGTPDGPSSELGLTGPIKVLAESASLGVSVIEQAGCRFVVGNEPTDGTEAGSAIRGEAILARVLFGQPRKQPDALLFTLPENVLKDAETSLWIRMNRLNDALTHQEALQVPLILHLTGVETLEGGEVVWRGAWRECLGFGIGQGAGQWLHDFTCGAQQLFERLRMRTQQQMSEEIELEARVRAQRFLTGVHESLAIVERLIFRIMNETSARRLAPLAVAMDRPADRAPHWTQHPVLSRIPSYQPPKTTRRARRLLEAGAWAGALAGMSAVAIASWQDYDRFTTEANAVAAKVGAQFKLDSAGGVDALSAWSELGAATGNWLQGHGLLAEPDNTGIQAALERGYQARLFHYLAPAAEEAWLQRLQEAPADIRHLSSLSKALGSLSGQTDWTDSARAFWVGLPGLDAVEARWLKDLATLESRPEYQRAHEALKSAMAAIPLEDQVMARLFDEDEVHRLGSVGVDELLGGKARAWLKSVDDVSVPRFYTSTGYHTLFAPRLDEVLALYREESRAIQGEADAFPEAALRLAAEQAYADRVEQAWKQAMGRVRLQRPDSESLAEYLLWLGSESESPVRHLLQAVALHTDFALAAPGSRLSVEKAFKLASMGQGMTARVAARAKRLSNILAPGSEAEKTPAIEIPVELRAIQKRFEPYREWLGADASSGRWQVLAATLSALGDRLQALEDAPASERYDSASKALLSSGARAEYRRQLREARALPEPARGWVVAALGQYQGQQSGYVRQAMQAAWKRIRSDWRQLIEGRYPFDSGAQEDVPVAQMAGLFGPQGELNLFYEEFVKPFVEETAGGLRNRKGSAGLGFSRESLQVLSWARRAKEALFDETGQFRVEMTWRPQYLDANLRRFEMDLNDEEVVYRHGPLLRKSVIWQAGSGKEGSRIQFVDYNGLTYHRSFEGGWGVHRLLMNYRPQTVSAGRYKVDFEIQGRRAVYELGFRDVHAWQLLATAPTLSMGVLFR